MVARSPKRLGVQNDGHHEMVDIGNGERLVGLAWLAAAIRFLYCRQPRIK
jgi:hypothetical protein